MSNPATRWLLSFDASCEQCRKVSEAVERAWGGKVDLLWAEDHRDSLPQDYDALTAAHPLPYRQAVWAALPPAARSRLWGEQLAR